MRPHSQGNATAQDFAAQGVNDFKEQPARFPHMAEEVVMDTHKAPEPQLLRSRFLSASKTITSLLEYDRTSQISTKPELNAMDGLTASL